MNFREKDQRENSTYICHTEPFCYHSAISGVVIALCVGRTKLGYVVPDMKTMTTMAIKWRSTSEPDKSNLGLQCMSDSNPGLNQLYGGSLVSFK